MVSPSQSTAWNSLVSYYLLVVTIDVDITSPTTRNPPGSTHLFDTSPRSDVLWAIVIVMDFDLVVMVKRFPEIIPSDCLSGGTECQEQGESKNLLPKMVILILMQITVSFII